MQYVFVRFWKKLKTPKKPFEITRPLVNSNRLNSAYVCTTPLERILHSKIFSRSQKAVLIGGALYLYQFKVDLTPGQSELAYHGISSDFCNWQD